MLHGKRTRRVIAATLLTVMLTNTIAPTVTYALTSGPTAPEATSFEPIDTTDMVNLLTGDFTYNIPLLEVPGPEGGYPLSLSYHAGIQPDEDASWVGLGWALNPGAINRNVNGYPDDWNGISQVRRDYWSGGSASNFGVDLSIGLGPASMSFGLSFSKDTYQGFGVGFNVGTGMGIGFGKFGIGMRSSMGMGPFGQVDASNSVGIQAIMPISKTGMALSANVGIDNSMTSTSFSGGIGVSAHGERVLGASMRSGSGNASFSVGGMTGSISNSKAGRVQTHNSGFSIPIPLPGGITLGISYNYQRYWSDETVDMATYGTIYTRNTSITDTKAFDCYTLGQHPDISIVDIPDPTRGQGGSYPEFDDYSVVAQGLSGNMRPYIYQGYVAKQNEVFEGEFATNMFYKIAGGSTNIPNPQPHFRFVNDFSNYLFQDKNEYTNVSGTLRNIPAPFDNTLTYPFNSFDQGYNTGTKRLAGSKHVDYFTKSAITDGSAVTAGFIKPRNTLVTSPMDMYSQATNDQICGFSITNESGVTYHFGLPVHSYSESVFTEKIDQSGGHKWNRLNRPQGYAYTWYLTTITGPDFIDRNFNGVADEEDFGYWVNFDYGAWSTFYCWRNPAKAFKTDIDNGFRSCSKGVKEVYYLNSISTRTHVALFEKFGRGDGLGVVADVLTSDNGWEHEGGYGGVNWWTSIQPMGLSKIYLVNKEDAGIVNPATNYDPDDFANRRYHGNVLDGGDISPQTRSLLESRSLRIIDLTYDVSLCPGLYADDSPNGKSTLKAISFRGKGGVSLIPSTNFVYDIPVEEEKSAFITTGPTDATRWDGVITTSGSLEKGDMLRFTINDINYYCTVLTTGTGTLAVQYLNSLLPSTGNSMWAMKTKNPPYNKDNFDMWGMYKCDMRKSILETNENLARVVTETSAANLDAWSLRQIKTSLGSKINIHYEADTYAESTLQTTGSLVVRNFVYNSSTQQLTFNVDIDGINLSDLFSLGDNVALLVLQHQSATPTCAFNGDFQFSNRVSDFRVAGPTYPITAIADGAKQLTVTCTTFKPNHLPSTIQTIECGQQTVNYGQFIRGNIFYRKDNVTRGGGIRVQSMDIHNTSTNVKNVTTYNYSTLNDNTRSSGVTVYEPTIFDKYNLSGVLPGGNLSEYYELAFKRALYSGIDGLLTISREIPPPGVMYEYVTVSNKVIQPGNMVKEVEGSSVYQYEVFNRKMVGRKIISRQVGDDGDGGLGDNKVVNLTIKNFTSKLGNLKRIIRLDDKGKKISEVINHFLHDDLENENDFDSYYAAYDNKLINFGTPLGFVHERYSEVKEFTDNPPFNHTGAYATMSSREVYPAIPTGQTSIDYITGFRTTTENLEFDVYSGAVVKSVETDEYGNRFLAEVVPAYDRYTAMGLKMNGRKNMLTQVTGNYLYKVNEANEYQGLVSANVTTWSKDIPILNADGTTTVWNIWRNQSTYAWQSDAKTADGLTSMNSFFNFNYINPSNSDPAWKKQTEITLYDPYSKVLESKDINNNFASTRMDMGSKRVAVSGGPANYYEVAYSGAEDDLINMSAEGFVWQNVGTPATDIAHTGSRSLSVSGTGTQNGFTYTVSTNKLIAGRDYMASVWVQPATTLGTPSIQSLAYQINGSTKFSVSSGRQANGWILLTLKISGSDITPGNTLTVICNSRPSSGFSFARGYMDDFRFQPLNATTTAFVYDHFSGEVSHILDNSNMYTRYVYDAAGRLVNIYREKLGIGEFKTNEFQYNMAGQ